MVVDNGMFRYFDISTNIRDVPNANPPQHGRRVHDPRHQAGQQGHGGGRAGDPGQGGDVIY